MFVQTLCTAAEPVRSSQPGIRTYSAALFDETKIHLGPELNVPGIQQSPDRCVMQVGASIVSGLELLDGDLQDIKQYDGAS